MAFDPLELIIVGIVLVVVLMWGPKKIPELARAIGTAKKEFIDSSKPDPTSATNQSGSTGDALVDAARRLGISTEGKTRQQISSEITKRVQIAA